MDSFTDLTRILEAARTGDEAAAQLVPLVYEELRRIAAMHMAGRESGHTLQPTALVHEAYMRITGSAGLHWASRAHFFSVASKAMRQVLVDHWRRKAAEKRGGGVPVASLDVDTATPSPASVDVLELHEALERLESLDVRQAKVVELRYFGGLRPPEIARTLGVSLATVERDWRTAKAWLNVELAVADDENARSAD
ncbi:MAG TPA: sigma-70 family RNA polymerase sigma factor [Planctomycetota bacterium]